MRAILLMLCFGFAQPLLAQEDAPWKKVIQGADGNFDRFINGLLDPSRDDMDAFREASRTARGLNTLLIAHSFLSLAQSNRGEEDFTTAFHDFDLYLRDRKPEMVRKVPEHPNKQFLVRNSSVRAKWLNYSMVLSQGNVDVSDSSGGNIIVAGGDVRCKLGMTHSLIIAAGDVLLEGERSDGFRNLVIAGGKITLQGRFQDRLLLISPHKVEIPPSSTVTNIVKVEGATKPKDLFTFPTLASYGVVAVVEKGQVMVLNTVKKGPGQHFQRGDIILSAGEQKIESPGQFRRLLGRAQTVGEMDFEVQRAGKVIRIREKLW